MHVIIADNRDISETDLELLNLTIKKSAFSITCVINGNAREADKLSES